MALAVRRCFAACTALAYGMFLTAGLVTHTLDLFSTAAAAGEGGLWCEYLQYYKSIMSLEGGSLYQMMTVWLLESALQELS